MTVPVGKFFFLDLSYFQLTQMSMLKFQKNIILLIIDFELCYMVAGNEIMGSGFSSEPVEFSVGVVHPQCLQLSTDPIC